MVGKVEEELRRGIQSLRSDPGTEDMESAVNVDEKTTSWSGPSLSGRSRRRQGGIRLVVSLLIAFMVLGIYFNSLKNNFVNWDDPGLILKNQKIRSLSWDNVRSIFMPRRAATFQPLRVLSYAVDYHFWKMNPMGYHLTNLFFYVLMCLMIFFTLQRLSCDLRKKAPPDSHFRVALFGALLFLAHPVHVEAVAWLSARKEVLHGFFFFLAFYLYLRGRDEEGRKRILYFGWVFLSVLLAILSKPTAVIFPAVILLYESSREKEKFISFLRTHRVFLGLSVVLSIIFGSYVLKVMIESGGIKPFRGGSFSSNLLVSLYSFVYSLKLLTFTINYSAAYTFSMQMPVYSIQNIAFFAIVLFLAGFSLFSLRWTKVIFFSFFFFVLAVLPYLNILPISTVLADRYVFVASFSYVFLLGILFDHLYGFRHPKLSRGFFKLLSTLLFLFLFVGYSFMTIERNGVWENSYTLWADAVEKSPESNTANALMGVVYMDLGMDGKAVEHLEKAVELFPEDYQSRNNLGIVYGRSGEPEKALREFAVAMQLRPDDDAIKINLSVFYQRQKEYENAERVLKDLIARNPRNASLYFRLGLVYRDMGKNEAALSELLKAKELAPKSINIYEELGNIYLSKFHDSEKAKFYYSQGVEAGSNTNHRSQALRWIVNDLESNR